MSSQREEFLDKLKQQVDDINAQMSEFETKAEEAGTQAMADFDAQMDKLREQFGLGESDPLPPALLAAAAATAPPSITTTASTSAAFSGDMYTAIGAGVAHSTNEYATAPADGPAGMPTSALDDFSPGGYYISSETLQPSVEATVNEVVTEEEHDTKRQKVSLDDVVPV